MKRFLSLLIAAVMVLSMIPAVSFAAEERTVWVDAKNGNNENSGLEAYHSGDPYLQNRRRGLPVGLQCVFPRPYHFGEYDRYQLFYQQLDAARRQWL